MNHLTHCDTLRDAHVSICTASECIQILADMFSKELGSSTEHSAEVSDSVGPLSGFVMKRCSDSSLRAKTASG